MILYVIYYKGNPTPFSFTVDEIKKDSLIAKGFVALAHNIPDNEAILQLQKAGYEVKNPKG